MLSKRHKLVWSYHNGTITLTCNCGDVLGKFSDPEAANEAKGKHFMRALKKAADERAGRVRS